MPSLTACQQPLWLNGTAVSGCLRLDSSGVDAPVCWVFNRGWTQCTANSSSSVVAVQAATRTTVRGKQCLLPYVVRVRDACIAVWRLVLSVGAGAIKVHVAQVPWQQSLKMQLSKIMHVPGDAELECCEKFVAGCT